MRGGEHGPCLALRAFMRFLVLLLWIAMPAAGTTAGSDRAAGAPSPVRDVTPSWSVADADSRMRVSNVTYAPLASPAGKPIGLRVTYQIQFAASGRYNPELRIVPADAEAQGFDAKAMHAIDSRIEPLPREANEPHRDARFRPGLLRQEADFLYEAGTVYTFTLDLVPDYIAFGTDLFTPCVARARFERDRTAREAFARRLAAESETAYRATIGGNAFEGRIDRFYGEGTLYRNFIADGGADCDELPISRR